MRSRWIAVAVVIAVLVAAALLWRSCRGASADEANVVVSVQVAKAERGTIANEISTVATLAARREATMVPKIAGQIKEMGLAKNSPVRGGGGIAAMAERASGAQ